jgi:Protein of unknown function VcgC/VcgE (DUF2780)
MSEMEIIETLTNNLGITDQQAVAAVGSCLHLIRSKSSDQGFSVIEQCIPECGDWMAACTEAGAEPAPPAPPENNDLASNEDEGVREAYQVEHFDASGGMGALVEEAASVFSSAKGGSHLGALAGLVGSFKTLGLEASHAAEAGPPLCIFLQERLGDDGFHALVNEVPMLKHLATGGTGSFTDEFGDRLSKFFRHHHLG